MKKHKHQREPLFATLRRSTIVVLGPLLYITLSLAPWLEGPLGLDFGAPGQNIEQPDFSWPDSWLPNAQELRSELSSVLHWSIPGLSKNKVYQAGPWELRLNLQTIRLRTANGQSSLGYRSTKLNSGIEFDWNAERPLLLTMADGSRIEALPLGHSQLESGFVLEFPQNLQLLFRDNATIEMAWPENQALPQKIALPLNTATNIAYNGKQIQIPEQENQKEQYFSALTQSRITEQGYIEIPLQYYRTLNPAANPNASKKGHISLPLLWQAPQTERSAAHELYNKVYRSYRENLLRTMQQNLAAGQIPASGYSDWLSLYLALILEPDSGQNPNKNGGKIGYEAAKNLVEAVLRENGWTAGLPLSPYLGIERAPLERAIRADYARMDEIQNNYLLENWSFVGFVDMGNMLFRYGRLNLLRAVLQRAATQRQSQNQKERFYLLHFLHQVSQVYPRNGIVGREAIKSEFSALLLRISRAWEQEPLQNIAQDLPYTLDVLKDLWSDNLGLQEQAYSLALKLFQLMDAQGNLGNLGDSETFQNAAYFRAFHFMGPQLREHPRNINVVPGFWLWTSGDASVRYISGQPIQMSTENFGAQGNKLLLLRGVYFYPIDVLVDGQIVEPAARMPSPKTGQPASWYYDVGNRLLAIEIPASTQERTALRIR